MDELLKNAKKKQKETAKKLEAEAKSNPNTDLSHMKTIDPVVFNEWAEDKFIEITRELIGEQKVRKAEVLRECAYELRVSVETIKRYLFKHTARRAEFREFDGWVFLNPNYVNPNGVDGNE